MEISSHNCFKLANLIYYLISLSIEVSDLETLNLVDLLLFFSSREKEAAAC